VNSSTACVKTGKRAAPSTYVTMPHYFPTEQVDIVVGKLKPEEKVNMAIEMTDAVARICAEGIRA